MQVYNEYILNVWVSVESRRVLDHLELELQSVSYNCPNKLWFLED